MPRNTRGGTGHKKGKNKPTIKTRKVSDIAKDFDPDEFEVYGKIVAARGNRRFEVLCQKIEDPSAMMSLVCKIKGSYRKRISKDMYVLIKLCDFNQSQGQIIDSYTNDELKLIKDAGKWDFNEHGSSAENERERVLLPESDSDSFDSESEEVVEVVEERPVSGSWNHDDDDLDIDNI